MNNTTETINPFFGMRISEDYDPAPKGFSDAELVQALNELTVTRHDYDMLMECAGFAEVDEYYNPGIEEVSDDFVLEAIVIDKFSKTERRMAAVVRVMNRHLGDSEIKALDPIVGKPRKTGSYAYVTVQLPFTDGQIVSVIFHAPEGDKKQIGPSDRIIAFRWLLNKRDITAVVAPEDGSEISLESIAKRITQLVVKNSARFERTQKEAQAERQELDKAREDLREAEERQKELVDNMETTTKEAESVSAELANVLAQVEKQKAINAELRAKLDGLRKAGQGNSSGISPRTKDANNDEESRARRALPNVAEVESGIIKGATGKEAKQLAKEWVAKNIRGPIIASNGATVELSPKDIENSLSHTIYQNKLDAIPALSSVLQKGEYLGSLPDNEGKSIDNHYYAAKITIGTDEKVVFVRTRKAAGNDNRFYVHEIFTEDEIKNHEGFENASEYTPRSHFNSPHDFYKSLLADYMNVKTGTEGANGTKDAPEIPSPEAWGSPYPEYSGKPYQAIEHLLEVKNGYVPGAFNKAGIGDIDLVWGKGGKKGYGLAHIIERRNAQGLDGEAFVRDIPRLVASGKVMPDESDPDTKFIVDDTKKAIIALKWENKSRAWLVTAYYTDDNFQGSASNTPLRQTSVDGQNPPSNLGNNENNINIEGATVNQPSFVNELNAIISGKYDPDIDKIDSLLDSTYDEAEAAGRFEEYEDLFNEAADHLTVLLQKEAEKYL